MADLEFIKDKVLGDIRRCRKRNDKSPQTLTPQLNVSSRDPVMTNFNLISRESTFVEDGGRLDMFMLNSATPQGEKKEFTTATSSQADGIDTGGTKTAHSIWLS